MKRIDWQDTARAVGILLVVFGHAERGLRAAHLLTDPIWLSIDFAIYTFHMPLFMFLSGLNVPRSLRKGKGPFVRKRLLTIFYPYILWSLIQGAVSALLSHFTNSPESWRDLAEIGWRPISPFWFLYVLFIFLMVAAFLPRGLFVIVAAIAFPCAMLLQNNSVPFQLLHFAVFFALGMVVGAVEPTRQTVPAGWAGAGALVLAGTIAVALWQGFGDYNAVWILPAALGGIVSVIWLAQRIERFALVVELGKLSMAIYVMHVLAASGTRIVLAHFLHPAPPFVTWLPICFIVGVLAPIAVYRLAEPLKLLPWLGLGTGPRGDRWIEHKS